MLENTLIQAIYFFFYVALTAAVIFYFSKRAERKSEDLFKKYNTPEWDLRLNFYNRPVKMDPKKLHAHFEGHKHAA